MNRNLRLAIKFGELAVMHLRTPHSSYSSDWARQWSIMAAHYARLYLEETR